MVARGDSDPLIDEVRQRRRDLYARYGHDLQKVAEAIRELQSRHPNKVFDRRRNLSAPSGRDSHAAGRPAKGHAE